MLSGPIFLFYFYFFFIGISSMSWLTRAFNLYIVFKLPNNTMYYEVRRIIQVYILKCKTQL